MAHTVVRFVLVLLMVLVGMTEVAAQDRYGGGEETARGLPDASDLPSDVQRAFSEALANVDSRCSTDDIEIVRDGDEYRISSQSRRGSCSITAKYDGRGDVVPGSFSFDDPEKAFD